MSLYFLVNNLSFAFGMIGAIICIIAAWLSFDAYKLQKNQAVLLRYIGLVFFAFWKVIDSLNTGNDVLLYFGFGIFLIGLVLLIVSFLKTETLAVNAIVIIPSFSLFSTDLYTISTILLCIISFLSVRQWKKEYNRTWIPFAIAFLFFAIGSCLNIFGQSQISLAYIGGQFANLFGFISLGVWVWQYMRLRIKESFIMISVGVTFILATVITLAFSTILIDRVNSETSNNLSSDVKVLSISIDSLKEESLAKTLLVSSDKTISDAISKNDMVTLDQSAQRFLDQYNLGFLTITDADGVVLIRAHALSKSGDSLASEGAFQEAVLKNPVATIENSVVEGFSIRAGAPIFDKNNKVIGAVIAGFPLDNVFADRFKKLTGLEMLVYNNDTSVASTLFDTDGVTRLVGETISDATIHDTVLTNDTSYTGSLTMYGKPYHASFLPLTNSNEKVIGMLSVAESEQDIVNIANATNRLTLITVILIMIILLVPIYFISKQFGRDKS